MVGGVAPRPGPWYAGRMDKPKERKVPEYRKPLEAWLVRCEEVLDAYEQWYLTVPDRPRSPGR